MIVYATSYLPILPSYGMTDGVLVVPATCCYQHTTEEQPTGASYWCLLVYVRPAIHLLLPTHTPQGWMHYHPTGLWCIAACVLLCTTNIQPSIEEQPTDASCWLAVLYVLHYSLQPQDEGTQRSGRYFLLVGCGHATSLYTYHPRMDALPSYWVSVHGKYPHELPIQPHKEWMHATCSSFHGAWLFSCILTTS
jgi:hypothetical protein